MKPTLLRIELFLLLSVTKRDPKSPFKTAYPSSVQDRLQLILLLELRHDAVFHKGWMTLISPHVYIIYIKGSSDFI